jgi:putative ABC transport system permease protein
MYTLRIALRNLIRLRLTGVAVLLLLTLGISLSLVVFCLVDATLLRPLLFAHPENLVALDDQDAGKSLGVSWGELQQWERAPMLFSGAAGFRQRTWALTDHTGAAVQVVLSGMVTPGFFGVLQQSAAAGSMLPSKPGADPHVAVLSYALWQTRYGGSASVLNSTLSLNGIPYRIVGMLPKSFAFSIDGATPIIYIPLGQGYCCMTNQRGIDGIARLAPGVSLAEANDRLNALAQRTARAEGLLRFASAAIPLQAYVARDARKSLLLLWLSVLAVTLVASLNAGALLLARSLRNLRQYALKLSFGARVHDLVWEQAAVAFLLSAIAGGTALLLSFALLRVLRLTAFFQTLPGHLDMAVPLGDWRIFSFCALVSLFASMAACMLPLTMLRGLSVERLLRGHAGMSSSHAGSSLSTAIITMQLGLSVMLLSAGFSFGYSLYTLLHRDPGFRVKNIVMAGIGIPDTRYDTDAKMIGFHEQSVTAIRALPGVLAAGFAGGAPIHPLKTHFALDESPDAALPASQRPRVDVAFVSRSMFHILGMPLLRGRNFDSSDRLGAPYAAIANQSFARGYLDPDDPLKRGMRVQFYNGFAMQPWSHFNIIGIVADSRSVNLDQPPAPELYLSTLQVAIEGGSYFLDTTRPASSFAMELPSAIWHIDPTLQRVEPMQLQRYLDDGFSSRSASLELSLGFAGLALLLAAIGLGAGISAAVSASTKEIGIRSALGESRQSIASRVLRLALTRTLLGTACGTMGAIAVSRIVTLTLDPKAHFDFWVLPPVTVLMLSIAALVSIVPARRALRISPVEALRAE